MEEYNEEKEDRVDWEWIDQDGDREGKRVKAIEEILMEDNTERRKLHRREEEEESLSIEMVDHTQIWTLLPHQLTSRSVYTLSSPPLPSLLPPSSSSFPGRSPASLHPSKRHLHMTISVSLVSLWICPYSDRRTHGKRGTNHQEDEWERRMTEREREEDDLIHSISHSLPSVHSFSKWIPFRG